MSLAIIFNGQGTHYLGMGQDFFDTYLEAQAVFEAVEATTEYPVRQWIREDIGALNQTRYAQVAIAATSLAIYKSIEKKLPVIDYMAGLSLGEYSSLIASGILNLQEGFDLLKIRGQLMTAHCEKLRETSDIMMEAVLKMPLAEIRAVIREVNKPEEKLYLANLNSSTQIIIAGTKEAISQFRELANERGYRKVMQLKVEGPFHSPYMMAVCEPYGYVLEGVTFHEGKTPVISNITVEPHKVDVINDLLVRHLVEPVRWQDTIDYFVEHGVSKIIQIGPGKTLINLLRREPNAPEALAIDQISDVNKIESFIGG